MDKRPIRILHVIGRMDRGGAETMIMNLYRRIDRERVQFDFVENCSHHAAFDDEIFALGGRIYHCPRYAGTNHFAYCRWWNRFFQEHGSDYTAVHGHLGSTAAIYLSAAKRNGIYTIAHSHNTYGNGSGDLLYRIYSFPTRRIADRFFACSVKAGLDRFGEKVTSDPTRFSVLNNAIETEKFRYDPQERERVRKELGLGDSIVFGHVGRFLPQKNHEFLMEIFREIARQCDCAKLLLIGDGPLREAVAQKARDYGLDDRVLFLGVREDVAPFYQAMDVFLFPSLFEGLGIVAVEAQTAGLPCVISDTVPEECVLTDDLVTVCRLEDGAKTWANTALSVVSDGRRDHAGQVAERGFDISATAGRLEQFYLGIGDRQ